MAYSAEAGGWALSFYFHFPFFSFSQISFLLVDELTCVTDRAQPKKNIYVKFILL